MRPYFVAITLLLAIWLGWIYPFVSTVRGRSLLRAILVSWGSSVVYFILLCFVAPMIVKAVDPEFGKEMFKTWVPEGNGVVGMAFLGWLPPLIAGGIGKLLHHVLQTFRTRRAGGSPAEGQVASKIE